MDKDKINKANDSDRRRFKRNELPRVAIIIEEQPYLAIDWSPGGFSFIPEDLKLSSGDLLRGAISIYGVDDPGEFEAKVIRISEQGQFSCQFISVSSHIYMNLCMTVALEDEDLSSTTTP